MSCVIAKNFRSVGANVRGTVGLCLLALFCGLPAFGVQSVTLSWNASADPTVVGYKIYYGTTSGVYPNSVDAGGATNVTITGLADGSTNYFAGTTYDSATNESPYSAEVAYVAPVTTVSTTPPPATNNALNVVSGLTVTVDPDFSNSVALSWNPTTDTVMAGYLVSYGPAGASPTVVPAWQHTSLVVTGLVAGVTNYFAVQEYDVSWNLGPMSPFASYCFPLSSGDVSISTNSTSTGTNAPTTTVTNTTPVVTNSTPTTTNASSITTPPAMTNTPPTLNALPGILLNINSPTQTVLLSGISSGLTNGNQTVEISAKSSKTGLIANPAVSYQSSNSTGNLLFKPKSGQTGTATITVTVNNGGVSNNIVTKSFVVTIINFADLPKITHGPKGAATMAGKNISLTVGASGQSLRYQWRFNGTNLPGAISSTLNLKKVVASNTGLYSVQVSNSLGITNSSPAVLTVITNTAPVFSTPVQANGQFSFEVSGVPGGKYVIEASSDLQHWSPVATNTAPFTFNDAKVAGYNQKFYRSYYAE